MKYSQEWWVDLGKFLVRLVTYDSPSKYWYIQEIEYEMDIEGWQVLI